MHPAQALRRELHRYPELAGDESETAKRIAAFFSTLGPNDTITGLGGNGVAFCFGSAETGSTIMLRCELDALPIVEPNEITHRSKHNGVAHKCGHDGHMAILAAVGMALAIEPPARGRAVLLFQPAEETGAGAAAVVADPKFATILPSASFALHNLPGFPVGQIVVRSGTMACASRGIAIALRGREAHAAQPETGVSPASALTTIVDALGRAREVLDVRDELAFVTVVGARLGAQAFGTAPGSAEIWATLRSETDSTMDALVQYAEQMARDAAAHSGLQCSIDYRDVFPATKNTPGAVAALERACNGLSIIAPPQPFRWSEDFGHFTALGEGALFGLGAGEGTPDLHDPEYDFPDELIETGARIFVELVRAYLA